MFKRIFVIVFDSLGVGHDPRAKEFGDDNCNTALHVVEKTKVNLPNLNKLGFELLYRDLKGEPTNGYGLRLNELSNAKDTLAGHWEMMGIKTDIPFPTFTENGFPKELIDELEKRFNKKILGNKAASGTEIIKELGEEELAGKGIIVYTSDDSVLQICAHEEKTGLDNLYKYSKIAREVCSSKPEWNVGRIIARPYIGTNKNNFTRTPNRHDYAIKPARTMLDSLKEKKIEVIAVGKIGDIFVHEGISEEIKIVSNLDGLEKTFDLIKKRDFKGLAYINLVDFDSKFGHRRDYKGYGDALVEADQYLGKYFEVLKDDDLLMITGDHGTDPTYPGWNHTREQVPLLIYNKQFKQPKILPTGNSFADLGRTIIDNFKITDDKIKIGNSFLKELI